MKQFLLPEFLKRYDRKLLLSNPSTWATRAHFVSWFSVLASLLLVLIFLIVPNDPRHESTVYLPTFFLVILSIVGIVFYLIYLLRFNVFKRFGNYTRASMLSSFLYIFISVGWLIFLPFIPSLVESYRAEKAYTTVELIEDTDRMNFLISEIIYDSLSTIFVGDTVFVSDSLVNNYNSQNKFYVENFHENGLNICTQSFLIRKIQDHDSIISIDKNLYVLLDAPDYQFLSNSKSRRYSNTNSQKQLSRLELFNKVHRAHKQDSLNAWNREFNILKNKYASTEYNYVGGEYYRASYEYTYTETGQSYIDKLNIRSIDEGLSNICFRKYFWYGESIQIFSRIWFYTVLGLSLLIFIFRHSTTKVFFLSLLVAVLLMMASGLLVAFLSLEEIGILNLMLFYIGIFFVMSFSVFKVNKKSRLNGISLNIFSLSIGFVPILIVFLNHAILKQRYDTLYYSYEFSNFTFHLQIAEVIGIILIVFMIPTFLYSSYRKWYALPDE
jgi:hypothetical protein